jgi:dihydrolipoamide dehydrogenase
MYIEAKEHFKNHGVLVSDVRYDLGAIMKQKENAVTGLTKGIEGLFKKNKVNMLCR